MMTMMRPLSRMWPVLACAMSLLACEHGGGDEPATSVAPEVSADSAREARAAPGAALKAAPPKQTPKIKTDGSMVWRWVWGDPYYRESMSRQVVGERVYSARLLPKSQRRYVVEARQGGEEVWKKTLEIPDDPEHALLIAGLLLTQLQLEVVPARVKTREGWSTTDHLMIFELSVYGYRTVKLDLDSGEVLGSSYAPPRFASMNWEWPGEVEIVEDGKRRLALDGDDQIVFQGRVWGDGEQPARGIRRVGAGGKKRWELALDRSVAVDAAMLAQEDALYMAHYHPIASGVSVSKTGLKDGLRHWHTTVTGIGPVEHSQYRNEVRAKFVEDHLVLFGKESGGRHITTLDPRTGREMVNVRIFKEAVTK